MFRRLLLIVPLLVLALVGSVAMAQDDTTVMTAEDPELGTIFTDAEGMTLYIFLNDEPNSGESTCYDQCAENWPVFSAKEPLTLPAGVPGELGTIERTDGSTQVTYNGWPLYYWVKDQAPGDTTGQDVGEVWYVAIPTEGDATPGAGLDAEEATAAASPAAAATTVQTAEDPELGTILTDPEGMTLYLFTNDSPGVSTCYDQCAENWPIFTAEEPLTLPAGVPGELTLIERTDGSTQVAYNGWPLYYWVKDQAPGDTTGQGVGDVWYVLNPAASADEMVIPGMATPVASPAASPTAGNVVEVSLTEFAIEMPTELPSGPTTFNITNAGSATHNFEIEGQGIEMELEENLAGGESGTLTVDLQPGTYEIYCPVGNHADMGMELELTVSD